MLVDETESGFQDSSFVLPVGNTSVDEIEDDEGDESLDEIVGVDIFDGFQEIPFFWSFLVNVRDVFVERCVLLESGDFGEVVEKGWLDLEEVHDVHFSGECVDEVGIVLCVILVEPEILDHSEDWVK